MQPSSGQERERRDLLVWSRGREDACNNTLADTSDYHTQNLNISNRLCFFYKCFCSGQVLKMQIQKEIRQNITKMNYSFNMKRKTQREDRKGILQRYESWNTIVLPRFCFFFSSFWLWNSSIRFGRRGEQRNQGISFGKTNRVSKIHFCFSSSSLVCFFPRLNAYVGTFSSWYSKARHFWNM